MQVNELSEHTENFLKGTEGVQLLATGIDYDFPVFEISKSSLLTALKALKENPETGFGFLTTLCGIHQPGDEAREFSIMYQLHNLEKNLRIRLKIFMSRDEMDVPSITGLWPAANWMERQEFDFFGFNFTGHPDLKRILNMDEMNYFPLRKEYPLEDASRDDKNDTMFGR